MATQLQELTIGNVAATPAPFPGAQKIISAQPEGYWDIIFEFC